MVSHPQAQDSHANDPLVGWLLVDIIAAGAPQSFNGLGSLIRIVSPRWAGRHAQFRRVLSYCEAVRPITYRRKQRREPGSVGTAVVRAGTSLREQVRHLEQNHDAACGPRPLP